MPHATWDHSWITRNVWVEVLDGRVGIIREISPYKVLVQFGADGPFERHLKTKIFLAPTDRIPEGIA